MSDVNAPLGHGASGRRSVEFGVCSYRVSGPALPPSMHRHKIPLAVISSEDWQHSTGIYTDRLLVGFVGQCSKP